MAEVTGIGLMFLGADCIYIVVLTWRRFISWHLSCQPPSIRFFFNFFSHPFGRDIGSISEPVFHPGKLAVKMPYSITREKLLAPIPGAMLIPLMFGSSLFGSLLPPGKIRSIAVTSVLGYLAAEVMANPTGKLEQDALLPIQSIIVLSQWVSFYLLHNPEKEYRRVGHSKNNNSKHGEREIIEKNDEVKLSETWWDKLKWVASLKMTLRGVGWNWEVKNIPPNPPQTKW